MRKWDAGDWAIFFVGLGFGLFVVAVGVAFVIDIAQGGVS